MDPCRVQHDLLCLLAHGHEFVASFIHQKSNSTFIDVKVTHRSSDCSAILIKLETQTPRGSPESAANTIAVIKAVFFIGHHFMSL
jgi:hypothetical protein